jgi:pantoate--beta-alanine ligase
VIQHLNSPQAAQQWCDAIRKKNQTIGFVATMGALHPGHISLINCAHEENDVVIVSIFVNPLQFNKAEDLEKYPRDEASDIAQLETVNVNAVFTGSPEAFLGESHDKNTVELADPGIYAQSLEGAHRPGHFAGVREVVSKLFNFVGPCRSYFGEKDYQQLQIIKQMAENMPGIEVIPCPTLREHSGLARSSRNARLSEQGLQQASIIYRAMQSANALWRQGVRSPQLLQQAMLEIMGTSDIELEYAELRDPRNWTRRQPEYDLQQARVFVAGSIEGVRLIDNMALES